MSKNIYFCGCKGRVQRNSVQQPDGRRGATTLSNWTTDLLCRGMTVRRRACRCAKEERTIVNCQPRLIRVRMLRGSAPRTPPAGNDRARSEKTRSRLHPFARLLPSPASHPRGRQRAMAFDAGLPVLRLACSQAQFVQERAWHGGGSAGSGYGVCWGHRQWGRRRRLPSG